MSSDSKETEFGSSDQQSSPSAGKNTGVVLVQCCAWKCVSTAISGGVDISEVPGCYLLQQMSSQWGSQKLLQGLVSRELTVCPSIFDLFLTQQIMEILSKGCKPDNTETLKLNSTNEYSRFSFKFCWMRIFSWIKLSRHSCSIWDKLGYVTWMPISTVSFLSQLDSRILCQ